MEVVARHVGVGWPVRPRWCKQVDVEEGLVT